MANKRHLKILMKGVKAWNAWREKNPEIKAEFFGADLSGADLRKANLGQANLINAKLSYAQLSGANFSRALLNKANLSHANLSHANLSRANLRLANLGKANFSHANLNLADLRLANFSDDDLILANFSGGDLSYADFRSANFTDADLSGANLNYADLHNANLSDADLRLANLSGANLSGAKLSSASLQGANLIGASINSASLEGTNLARARMGFTALANVELLDLEGLDEVVHDRPSTIGADTLVKSKGKTPDAFLRGCGFSDWEIVAAKLHDPDLTSEQVIDLAYEIARIKAESPIQVNPLFISYSRTNSDFTDALELRLNDKRIRFWRDIHDMVAGPLEEQVERAIEINRIMLLVLSKDSIESDWVESEVIRAREIAKERKEHVLCPIAIDDSWKTCPWERKLRVQVEKYNILDFSKWKDWDEFDKAFQKLIEGLGIFYPKPVSANG